MHSGKQIKIIKQAERVESHSANGPTSVRRAREKSKRDTHAVVKTWVGELRRKKSEEAAKRFDSIFGNAA